MKVKVLVHLTGLIDGQPWPEVGGEIDLNDVVAADLIEAGYVEKAAGKRQGKAEQQAG